MPATSTDTGPHMYHNAYNCRFSQIGEKMIILYFDISNPILDAAN